MTLTYEDLTGVLVEGQPLDAAMFEEDTADSDVELIDFLAGKLVDSEVNLDAGLEDLDLLPIRLTTVPKFKGDARGSGHIPKDDK